MAKRKQFFEISAVSRDDLEWLGFNTDRVSDNKMKQLASKLGDDYCDQLFWESLRVLVGILGIPKRRKPKSQNNG